MISGSSQDPQGLLSLAWHRVLGAYRPGIIQAQRTHFKTFLSVLVFYNLTTEVSASNLLIFLNSWPEIPSHPEWFETTSLQSHLFQNFSTLTLPTFPTQQSLDTSEAFQSVPLSVPPPGAYLILELCTPFPKLVTPWGTLPYSGQYSW